ncbi:MAG: hypothetical protein GY861_25060 [bacterium]|nr:hypothetical protein [bacterium]
MTAVQNYAVYNDGMARSMYDKLFWVDKVKTPDCIVDFGCADGTLIKASKHYFPNARYIGVDNAPQETVTDCEIVNKFEELSDLPENTLLILSSVIHEVYSYADIDNFWANIVPFQQIVVRDMAVTDAVCNDMFITPISKVRENYPEQYADFVKVWGRISNKRDMIHFLLKYMYTENWEREVQENYLPLSVEEMVKQFTYSHSVDYINHQPLPYLNKKWNKEFGFGSFNDTATHIKLILERT